jgi:hypothetical protein
MFGVTLPLTNHFMATELARHIIWIEKSLDLSRPRTSRGPSDKSIQELGDFTNTSRSDVLLKVLIRGLVRNN